MLPRSHSHSFLNANLIAIIFYLCTLRSTPAELIATAQRLVQVGQRYHAECHYDHVDVGRFLYWTIHTRNARFPDEELTANFGGVDLTPCHGFSFDASNAVLALNADLQGLTGQITCGLNKRTMGLHIDNVRPEYNRLRFSCNSGRNDSVRSSNEVSLIVIKPRLLALEVEAIPDKNHTVGVSSALRATCRVNKSVNPKFLYWGISDIEDNKNHSTLGGIIVKFCYRYKVLNVFHEQIDFDCHGSPEVSSTLTVKSLPVGTTIFCYVSKKNHSSGSSRIESNRLLISGSGRFTKVSISTKSSPVSVGGRFEARCSLLSSEFYFDRITWRGREKFGRRWGVIISPRKKESLLIIEPIYATDNQSQISCGIVGEPASKSERFIIMVEQKVETSLSILRDESTIEPVPINGTFQAVCSFKNIDTKTVNWIVTKDHAKAGRVLIRDGQCWTNILITNAVTTSRVRLSCNMTSKTTTFSVKSIQSLDAGAEIYCTAVDQYGQFKRSESLFIRTQYDRTTANIGQIAKTRPNYREATLAASCPYGNSTAHLFMVQQVGKNNSGSDRFNTGNNSALILHDRNCSTIDSAINLPLRFFVDCHPDSKSYTLIIDPVYANYSDDYRVTCAWYADFVSSDISEKKSEKEVLRQTSQTPQIVFPVSKPTLNYSGDMIRTNETVDALTSVWLIPVDSIRNLEFSCTAGVSQSTNFNLSLYIQTDKNFSYLFQGETIKSNDTEEIFTIHRKLPVKSSYLGVFCVAENLVSRWESDWVKFLHSYSSVFVALDDLTLPDSTFFGWRWTRTLKLCLTLCEIGSDCLGVSYKGRLCSLSKRVFNNTRFLPHKGLTFHQRYPVEDVLQRNNFWPEVYFKHENKMLPFSSDIDSLIGLSVTECKRKCSKILTCKSIQYRKDKNICHLSRLMSVDEYDDTDRNRDNWDVYTKNNTPGSFIAVRDFFPWGDSTPVMRFTPSGPEDEKHLLMQCADFCRSRNDCVSFVSTFEENKNSTVCLLYDVNIAQLRLFNPAKFGFIGSFYIRVRSFNSELLPVYRHHRTEKAPPIS